jgi:hypothetical protein
MDSVYILVINERGYDPVAFPESYATEQEAREAALKLLKDSYQCNVMEDFDYDELRESEDCDCIVESELAYYEWDEVQFQYIVQKVNLPKGE